jgi:hypothetical protein
VELLKFDSKSENSILDWAKENSLGGVDEKWGIVSQHKSKEETQFLSLSFKKVQRNRLKLQNGRIERVQEETTEPELTEFHFRHDGLLELYSCSAKQKSAIARSLSERYGKDCLAQLYLAKDAMKSLMTEAIEISSVSLTGLGNPFFNDATLTGTDPSNSKTFKDLSSTGEIKSFRGRFPSINSDSVGSPLTVAVSSTCKIRFFGTQTPVAQEDIEDFNKKVTDIATAVSEA